MPKAHFDYRGRTWRIYKREIKRSAPWYLEFEHHHKRYKHSLGEVEQQAAIANAKIKINAVLDGYAETLKASMLRIHKDGPELCTLGKIISTYDTLPLDIGEDTRNRNVNCFRLVLRKALGIESEAVDLLSSSVLTDATAAKYFEAVLQESKARPDQVEAARCKRSGNSIFNQAKSILKPKALKAFQRLGLELPDVAGFMNAYKAEKFEGVKNEYNPPGDDVIEATLKAWAELGRNEFIAVGLALSCGLRKAEIAQVRWGMFSAAQGSAMLDARGFVKNQSGIFRAIPIDPFWAELNERIDRERWRGNAEALCLQGTATDLDDTIFRNISLWLRGLAWSTQKTNHALRAYAGSLVAMKFGIWRASVWLRHASVETTQSFYTHFLNERVFQPDQVPISWANRKDLL